VRFWLKKSRSESLPLTCKKREERRKGYFLWRHFKKMEAASRFELEIKVLQTSALPLGYAALDGNRSGK
jgi:hypothetical protein